MLVRKVLFPTDFTEGALNALPYAADMARVWKAKLYMVHVVYDVSIASGLFVPHVSMDELFNELAATARKELEAFGLEKRRDITDIEYDVLRGTPYEEILKFAGDKGVDIIVLGTHGRKGLDRFLFGSTAEKIVRYSSCPVLTVRGEQEK